VPVVPGSEGRVADPDEARRLAEKLGFPVMIKASAGGGGRGIRVAETAEALGAALDQAAAEAKAAFGDGGLYLEKFIGNARHIEVQILGDGVNAIHCYERECSLQRRRQKVWEEAPAAVLSLDVREALCASAVALARSVSYRGAGTLEYLYDEKSRSFYFIEMNTRIQVEHPVTEMITGIDLVNEQNKIAAGSPLTIAQEDVRITGAAIECRINAEHARNFTPSPGRITYYHPPGGLGVRVDSAVYQGYVVPPYYDSLIGKLIVHGRSRTEALMRLRRALDEYIIDGVETTLPLFRTLVRNNDIQNGVYDIHWLEKFLAPHAEEGR
jgi:acetyl-CoA carboxylase biotin carboxylase subunit